MNHLLRPLLAAACLCAAAVVSSAQGSGPQPAQGATQPWMQFEKQLGLQTTYACDMVMQTGGLNMNARIIRDGGKTRSEMTMPFLNLKLVSLEIPEGARTTAYSLFPDKKKYALNEAAMQVRATAESAVAANPPRIEDLGTETYEGEACLKRRIVTDQDGMHSDLVMLLSPRQKNMPVKLTMTATVPAGAGRPALPVQSVILFKNYDFTAPAAALFSIPADYTKAASMQAIMMESMPDMGAMMQQLQPKPAAE